MVGVGGVEGGQYVISMERLAGLSRLPLADDGTTPSAEGILVDTTPIKTSSDSIAVLLRSPLCYTRTVLRYDLPSVSLAALQSH